MLDDRDTSRALRRLRELSNLRERNAARLVGVSRKTLRSWENHELVPTPQQLARAVAVYCHDVRKLIVPRQTIISPEDPDTLVVGSQRIDLAAIHRDNPSRNGFNRNVLARYLDAVRAERGEDIEFIELRATDLYQLSQALDLSDDDLGRLLTEAFNLTPAGTKATSRALLAAAILSVSVLGTISGPWFTPLAAASSTTAAEVRSSAPIFTTDPSDSEPVAAEQKQVDVTLEPSQVFSTDPRGVESSTDPKALPAGKNELAADVSPEDSSG